MVSRAKFLAGLKALRVLPMGFGVTFGDPLVDVYFGKLGDRFTDESWSAACDLMLETKRSFPAIADFLELGNKALATLDEADAGKAWAMLSEPVRTREMEPRDHAAAMAGVGGRRITERIVRERLETLPAAVAMPALLALMAAGGISVLHLENETAIDMARKKFVSSFATFTVAHREGRALDSGRELGRIGRGQDPAHFRALPGSRSSEDGSARVSEKPEAGDDSLTFPILGRKKNQD